MQDHQDRQRRKRARMCSETFGLSSYLLTAQGKAAQTLVLQQEHPVYRQDVEALCGFLNVDLVPQDGPPPLQTRILISGDNEHYTHSTLYQDRTYWGQFLCGPVLLEQDAQGTADSGASSAMGVQSLVSYHSQLPRVGKDRLMHTALMIHYVMNGSLIGNDEILFERTQDKRSAWDVPVADRSISRQLQDQRFHHNPADERAFYNLIKDGRPDDLRTGLRAVVREGELGTLARHSSLRSHKNLIISGIAIATRYAIAGGLNSETAFSMSDHYIQHVEELQALQGISELFRKACCDFAQRVAETSASGYSRPIAQAMNYLRDHVYQPVTLKGAAKAASLSPTYFSARFRQEVGEPPMARLQRLRVEEAKNLLQHSRTELPEISAWLQFSDQSHFTRVFQKHTGQTPGHYRRACS